MNKANDFLTMLNAVDSDIYQRFKTAIEIGRWPNGERLSQEQKSLVMQAIIVYEKNHLAEHERTGYVSRASSSCETHEHSKQKNDHDKSADQPIRWKC